MGAPTHSADHAERIASASAQPADRAERLARVTATCAFIVAASYTLRSVRGMDGGMAMPGGWTMSMTWMAMPGHSVATTALAFLGMWQAMMVAMMLPSSWPMLELYGRVARHTDQRHPILNTVLAGIGYFIVWGAVGLLAFAVGFEVSRAAMASAYLSRWIPAAAGGGLVLAGLWQLTPLKQACLKHCREPLLFLGHAYRPGLWAAFRVGLHHGAFCVACCWALMLIQLVLGIMNLAVMVTVAAVIAFEKLWRSGPVLAHLVGVVSIASGLVLILRSL
jgi:predicted metal-binding membrane protein